MDAPLLALHTSPGTRITEHIITMQRMMTCFRFICTVSVSCYSDWDANGLDITSSPFYGTTAIGSLDCFSRCQMTKGCTVTVFQQGTAGTGTCWLKSSSSGNCKGSGCTGTTGGLRNASHPCRQSPFVELCMSLPTPPHTKRQSDTISQ